MVREESMTSHIVKIVKENSNYVLFNERGMVLELTASEHELLQKHIHDKTFPKGSKKQLDFFNKLAFYEMLSFKDYTPKAGVITYSKKLLTHNSTKPVYPSPIVAHLGITQACNMRCQYCSIRQSYNTYDNIHGLSSDDWKKIIKKLSELGVFQIGFTGGEPTLRKDLVELAEYVTQLNCTFNLTTNCWNVSEQLIMDLKNAGMRQCQVSLDSHIPEINDLLRNKGSFDRVIKTVKLMQKHDIIVGIDCVVSNNNIDSIPGFIKWLTEMNVPFITLIKIKQGDLPLEKFKALLPEYIKYSKLLEELSNRKNENPCATIDCGSVSNLQYFVRDDELDSLPVAGCPVGHTLLSISPNGDMYPCVALSQSEFKIGNALTDDLTEVWNNNPKLQKLRLVKKSVKGKCQNCDRLDYCRGG